MTIRILVYSAPVSDGWGDLYHANRMSKLLSQENPEWDVQLYIERIKTKYLKEDPNFVDTNPLAQELSTVGYHAYDKKFSPNNEEFIPNVIVNVAGLAPEDRTNDCKRNTLKLLKERNPRLKYLGVKEYSNRLMTEMLTLAEKEKLSIIPLDQLGNSLPTKIREQIHKGNYYFVYGRRLNKAYIEELIQESSETVYVVAPGARAISIAAEYKVLEVSYQNKDNKITEVPADIKVVLIRGSLAQDLFLSLLAHTKHDEVLVTGDMSLTEAFYLNKLPIYDSPYCGAMIEELYGIHREHMIYKKRDPVEFMNKKFVENNKKYLLVNGTRIKEDLQAKYQKICFFHLKVSEKIREYVKHCDLDPPIEKPASYQKIM